MNSLTKSGLNKLEYSRRLQECCFLLRKKYNFGDQIPLIEFWNDRERHFLKWNDIPQVRSVLEYDLNRACLLCGLNPNLNNYLLIFTFAHYGVWRTIRWLNKEDFSVKKAEELQLAAAYKTINYLYSLILSSREHLRIDPLVDIFIEKKVFKWIKENNWGSTYIEKPTNENELKKFLFQTTQTFPLEIANIAEAIDEKNYGFYSLTDKRKRETQRNYYFWRWSKRGFTFFEMWKKWEKLNNIIIDEDFDRASADDKVNKGLKSYLSTHGPLFENTIELFKRFLNFYNEKEAAERVFELAAEKVKDILEIEMTTRLDKLNKD